MIYTKAQCDECGEETAELDGNVIGRPHWSVCSSSYCTGYFVKSEKNLGDEQ